MTGHDVFDRMDAARSVLGLLAALVLVFGVSACNSNLPVSAVDPAEVAGDAVESNSNEVGKDPSGSEKANAPSNLSSDTGKERPALETWDVIYMGNAKIGHSHTVYRSLDEGQRELLEISNTTESTMQRFGDTTQVGLVVKSVETPSGEVVRFSTRQSAGTAVMTTVGRFSDAQIQLETTTLGKTVKNSIAWDSSWRGFFGFEQSLRDQPMQPGEQRTVRCLLPVFNLPGDILMRATQFEDTPMVTGTRNLLKIQSAIEIDGHKIEQVLWMDESGQVLKTLVPSMSQFTYRTTKEVALGKPDNFDLGAMSLVEINRRLDEPHQTRKIVYVARLRHGDPADVFATGPTQEVKQLSSTSVELTVRSITPDEPKEISAVSSPQPTDDDMLPNSLIQSDDRRIREIASSVASDETDPWSVARAMESHVYRIITEKSFTQAFATAAEVAESREGDCTEHAVLLAALCRAREIPARVAIGLVYVRAANRATFGYHMWTEAWIQDRWIPLDATLGRGGIGASHIKIASSNLQGATAYSTFLPVIQVIGQLELEIISVN